MIVPAVEVGYPGKLSLTMIEELLTISVQPSPLDPIVEILRSLDR